MKSFNEEITWFSSRQRPDADVTVLINSPAASEPVWVGYWDGERWRLASGEQIRGVKMWAHLPAGLAAMQPQGGAA